MSACGLTPVPAGLPRASDDQLVAQHGPMADKQQGHPDVRVVEGSVERRPSRFAVEAIHICAPVQKQPGSVYGSRRRGHVETRGTRLVREINLRVDLAQRGHHSEPFILEQRDSETGNGLTVD